MVMGFMNVAKEVRVSELTALTARDNEATSATGLVWIV